MKENQYQSASPAEHLERVHSIALYRHLKYGWASIFDFDPEDAQREDYVQISEPLDVRFTGLTDDAVIQNACASLDAAERAAYNECNRKVAEIRAQKSELLALSHQPETEQA